MDFLNGIGLLETKDIRKLSELSTEIKYRVYNLQTIETLYGRRVVAELTNFSVFLPSRFTKLTNEQIEEYNTKRLTLHYLGKKDVGFKQHADIVKFEEI